MPSEIKSRNFFFLKSYEQQPDRIGTTSEARVLREPAR